MDRTHQKTSLKNWIKHEAEELNCTFVQNDKDYNYYWYSNTCSKSLHFFCSDGDGLALKTKGKSWYEAQKFCQEEQEDLATVTAQTHLSQISHPTWIGLFRGSDDVWRWAGQKTSWTHWTHCAPDQPDNVYCRLFSGVGSG